jgi:hypothetical protein
MAQMITPLSRQTLSRMTSGEKGLARRFASLLEDDYLVWYDIPVGKRRRYPDFILLHPSRGLLFLEVKDRKAANIQQISKSHVSLLTANGLKTKPHPLEQVRQGAYQAIDLLARDPALQQTARAYRSNLSMPYGWGVVFTLPRLPRERRSRPPPRLRRFHALPQQDRHLRPGHARSHGLRRPRRHLLRRRPPRRLLSHSTPNRKEILRLTGMRVATIKRELDRMLATEHGNLSGCHPAMRSG